MEIYEITGYKTGVSKEGVNYLQPADSFQNIKDGYIYRQVLQSRKGFRKFSTGFDGDGHLPTRVMGIFQNYKRDGTTETLAVDKNYLYRYNEGTNAFDRIPFGGTLAAFTGFNIASNEFYVSGTTYPDKAGNNRFVFTGRGMPGVYFYNGTDVRDYTNVTDNADYVAPPTGALSRAWHVIWFGERLNFIAPTLGGSLFSRSFVFSGIRDSAGAGDDFAGVGSGIISLDTFETIKGARILGDRLSLNLEKSNWIIEKTRDVFNPYFSRRTPSVLGTDAPFSSVRWGMQNRSLGRTGIISTDGRDSLRVDNKIPLFTQDEIDAEKFNYTYGGFNRATGQFLWSYVDSATESSIDTQNKVLVNNYEEDTWSVYNQRFSVFGESTNGQNLPWNSIDENQNPAWLRWDTTEEIWDKIGVTQYTEKTLAGDDLGFIYELDVDFDDYFVAITGTGITKAAQAVVSTEDQALQVGDIVVFENVGGMTEINGLTATVVARTINSITVNIDSTQFTTYTSGGSVSKIIEFEAETIPFNPYRSVGQRCYISHVEILLDTIGGALLMDIFQNEETSPFKKDVILQTSDPTTQKRVWITVSVNNIADFMRFKFKQNSASAQVKITSMRIHCEPAGGTYS